MVKTIEAIFDGTVLRPAEPLELEPNTRVRITVESVAGPKGYDFSDLVGSLRWKGDAVAEQRRLRDEW